MSNFIINLGNDGTVNGTVELSLTELDSTSTDLKLVGSMAVGYGLAHAENFAKLLTNFASTTNPPSRPKIGQLWYKADDKGLKLYTNTGWVDVYSAGATASTPLSISQGGTGRSTGGAPLSVLRMNSTGTALEYVSAETIGGGLFVKTNNDSSPTVNDTWSIGTPSLKFKNIYATSFKGKADSAFTADSASTVPWSGVTGRPTTMAGLGITDSVDKNYVDTNDYLNFSPQAGYLFDNKVPVSASFQYSLGRFGSRTFFMIDSKGRQNLFYHTTTPLRDYRVFRAWRYSDTEQFVFDNEPISAPFLNPNEKIHLLLNVGYHFIYARIHLTDVNQTFSRAVIIRTNGSSEWSDWSLAYNVTSLESASNFFLAKFDGVERLLRLHSTGLQLLLKVYDTSLVELRSLVVYDDAWLDKGGTSGGLSFASYAEGYLAPFIWNQAHQTFHLVAPAWYTYLNGSGATVGVGYGVSLAWDMPKTYLDTGSGTPTNLISIKSGSYRYRKLPDSTWSDRAGGMANSLVSSGSPAALYCDEFTGDTYISIRGTWEGTNTCQYRKVAFQAGNPPVTWGIANLSSNTMTYTGGPNIPDGSPWSKSIDPSVVHIIDDNLVMYATSSKFGNNAISTTFSTANFKSSQSGVTNDTLIIDPVNVTVGSSVLGGIGMSSWGRLGTTVNGSTPIYYATADDRRLYTVGHTGHVRNYTDTGLVVPPVPSTLGTQTGLADTSKIVVWNGSSSSPIFWSTVKNTNGLHMAKCVGGSWSLVSENMFQAQIDSGKTNRGDASNSITITSASPILTANGRMMFAFYVPHVGGSAWYIGLFDVNSNTPTSLSSGHFAPTGTGSAGRFANWTPYPNSCFGYSTTFGYYHSNAVGQYEAAAIVSSRDVRTGTSVSEDDWFNNVGRSQIWITVESATGLVAYVSAYPIFLGGYLTTTPNVAVALQASATNYIYATRASGTDKTVTISTSTTMTPSGNTRVLIAEVVTNATSVVSQKSYIVARHDRVEDLANVEIGTKTPGDLLAWNGEKWTTTQGVAGATGGGSDKIFYENDRVVTADYTITAGKNAMTAGPITINNGVTITIPNGSTWTII